LKGCVSRLPAVALTPGNPAITDGFPTPDGILHAPAPLEPGSEEPTPSAALRQAFPDLDALAGVVAACGAVLVAVRRRHVRP
jgi:hypothetical protein